MFAYIACLSRAFVHVGVVLLIKVFQWKVLKNISETRALGFLHVSGGAVKKKKKRKSLAKERRACWWKLIKFMVWATALSEEECIIALVPSTSLSKRN